MSMPDSPPVIVFDGVCRLCSRWVRFIVRHDRNARFRFAPMQSAPGRELLLAHGLDPEDPLSFLLVEGGVGYSDSDAILRVLRGCGGPWRMASALRIVPRALRNAAYRWLARNRYRWFGRNDSCMLPPADIAGRFLDQTTASSPARTP